MPNTEKGVSMKPEERLIVAADFKPSKGDGAEFVRSHLLTLAYSLRGTGVIIKINSVLRALGYSIIDELHELGLQVFADLKLVDIPATMEIDGRLLNDYRPEIVTAMCQAGVEGLHVLNETASYSEVLGVTVLTSLDEEDCQALFTCSSKAGVLRFARMAQLAGLKGLILSPKENEVIESRRFELSLELNNPGIRPRFAQVEGDDQKRVLSARDAIASGAKRVVVGRPITQAEDPMKAVHMTLDEINQGLADREK